MTEQNTSQDNGRIGVLACPSDAKPQGTSESPAKLAIAPSMSEKVAERLAGMKEPQGSLTDMQPPKCRPKLDGVEIRPWGYFDFKMLKRLGTAKVDEEDISIVGCYCLVHTSDEEIAKIYSESINDVALLVGNAICWSARVPMDQLTAVGAYVNAQLEEFVDMTPEDGDAKGGAEGNPSGSKPHT